MWWIPRKCLFSKLDGFGKLQTHLLNELEFNADLNGISITGTRVAWSGRLNFNQDIAANNTEFFSSNPSVDAICGLSLLFVLSIVLRVLWFSFLHKNQPLQISH